MIIGFCDCCDRGPRGLTRLVACGIETVACAECTGGIVCPACGFDEAYCECDDQASQEASSRNGP